MSSASVVTGTLRVKVEGYTFTGSNSVILICLPSERGNVLKKNLLLTKLQSFTMRRPRLSTACHLAKKQEVTIVASLS